MPNAQERLEYALRGFELIYAWETLKCLKKKPLLNKLKEWGPTKLLRIKWFTGSRVLGPI